MNDGWLILHDPSLLWCEGARALILPGMARTKSPASGATSDLLAWAAEALGCAPEALTLRTGSLEFDLMVDGPAPHPGDPPHVYQIRLTGHFDGPALGGSQPSFQVRLRNQALNKQLAVAELPAGPDAALGLRHLQP